jgi:hypothetical protein
MKTYFVGVVVQIHVFLISALVGGESSASCPGRFTPGKDLPRYPFDRGLGGPQRWSGSHKEKILYSLGTRTRSLGRGSHSQPLYRLSYSGSSCPRCIKPTNICNREQTKHNTNFICDRINLCTRYGLSSAVRGSSPGLVMWDFVVDKVALGQVFSEYFGFSCQFSFHQLLQKSSSSITGVCTIDQSGRSTRGLDT